jgi:hypothetical protein
VRTQNYYTTPQFISVTMASVHTALPTAEEYAAAGEAAQEVVRKYFVQLCNAIPRGDVLGYLYANKLIDQKTFERYVEPAIGLTTTEKIGLVVLNVQTNVARGFDKAATSEITSLCDILRREKDQELTALADAIEGMDPPTDRLIVFAMIIGARVCLCMEVQ